MHKHTVFLIFFIGDTMLNYIWVFMMVVSFICAIFTGNMENLSQAVSKESMNGVNLIITLASGMCFWSGILKIMEKSGLTDKFSLLLSPLINIIFHDIKNKKTKSLINMNITSNILGLGNAATPFGIKAMQALDKENGFKNTSSNSMCRFVLLNTASIQLIPTTLITLRTLKNGICDSRLLYCIWISSFSACIFGIILCFICERFKK